MKLHGKTKQKHRKKTEAQRHARMYVLPKLRPAHEIDYGAIGAAIAVAALFKKPSGGKTTDGMK